MFKEEINCVNHKDSKFLFYCFDDKSYLCEKCFREHKSHNVEIKEDIKKVSAFVETLKKTDSKNMKQIYTKAEKNLKDIKEKIEQILLVITKIVEKLQDIDNIEIKESIFDLKYSNFVNLLNCINFNDKVNNVAKKSIEFLNNLTKELNYIPTNFKYINKEVSVVDNSNIHNGYIIDILLGKSTNYEYTLFNGAKNHYLIVDLNKKYYLKSIRIQVTKNDCTLKNFVVHVKETNNEKENWIKINDFIRKRENQDNQYESFNIEHFCRQVKFDFIDTWGISEGNYILIKRIDFEVGE